MFTGCEIPNLHLNQNSPVSTHDENIYMIYKVGASI